MVRVLVLDDDEITTAMLQTRFEAKGYVVDTAENGRRGLAKMKTFNPDVVITDIEMPELDGLGFLTNIREPKTQTYPCKVIVMSSDAVYLSQASSLGVDAIFEKPINIGLLTDRVRELAS